MLRYTTISIATSSVRTMRNVSWPWPSTITTSAFTQTWHRVAPPTIVPTMWRSQTTQRCCRISPSAVEVQPTLCSLSYVFFHRLVWSSFVFLILFVSLIFVVLSCLGLFPYIMLYLSFSIALFIYFLLLLSCLISLVTFSHFLWIVCFVLFLFCIVFVLFYFCP